MRITSYWVQLSHTTATQDLEDLEEMDEEESMDELDEQVSEAPWSPMFSFEILKGEEYFEDYGGEMALENLHFHHLPPIHEDQEYGQLMRGEAQGRLSRPGNILTHSYVEWGDLERALAPRQRSGSRLTRQNAIRGEKTNLGASLTLLSVVHRNSPRVPVAGLPEQHPLLRAEVLASS